jgi:hypothetical protein
MISTITWGCGVSQTEGKWVKILDTGRNGRAGGRYTAIRAGAAVVHKYLSFLFTYCIAGNSTGV